MARGAIGLIGAMPRELKLFALLPFAHSEDLTDQSLSVRLHRRHLRANLSKAQRHRSIIRRFGRFPHRNAILGRHSTPPELRYMHHGGFQG